MNPDQEAFSVVMIFSPLLLLFVVMSWPLFADRIKYRFVVIVQNEKNYHNPLYKRIKRFSYESSARKWMINQLGKKVDFLKHRDFDIGKLTVSRDILYARMENGEGDIIEEHDMEKSL